MCINVGTSRTEDDLLDVARDILKKDKEKKESLFETYLGEDPIFKRKKEKTKKKTKEKKIDVQENKEEVIEDKKENEK